MQRGALRRRRLRLCKRARCFFCNPGNLQEFWCVAKPGAPQARAIRTGEHVARRPTCTECRSEYPEGDSDTTRAHQDRRQVATVSVFWAFLFRILAIGRGIHKLQKIALGPRLERVWTFGTILEAIFKRFWLILNGFGKGFGTPKSMIFAIFSRKNGSKKQDDFWKAKKSHFEAQNYSPLTF